MKKTLDLILTRTSDNILDLADVNRLVLNHFLVSCSLNFETPPCQTNTYAFRKKFKLNIFEKLNLNIDNLDSLIEHFYSTVKSTLMPQYDNETHIAKRQRRVFERKWKNPGNPTTKTNFRVQTLRYNELISAKKRPHITIKKSRINRKTRKICSNQLGKCSITRTKTIRCF